MDNSFSECVSSIIIVNQAINLYGGPEASAKREFDINTVHVLCPCSNDKILTYMRPGQALYPVLSANIAFISSSDSDHPNGWQKILYIRIQY